MNNITSKQWIIFGAVLIAIVLWVATCNGDNTKVNKNQDKVDDQVEEFEDFTKERERNQRLVDRKNAEIDSLQKELQKKKPD